MSLPHLPSRRTNGRKTVVDYSQNHVVTLEEYLRIMQQKAMDREATKWIQKNKRKERQKKQARKTFTLLMKTILKKTCKITN
jgi:hypothetical protein